MSLPMPQPDQHQPCDEIYRNLVDSLPEKSETHNVVTALGMLLTAIIIETAIDKEKRIIAAERLCGKIMQACREVDKDDDGNYHAPNHPQMKWSS